MSTTSGLEPPGCRARLPFTIRLHVGRQITADAVFVDPVSRNVERVRANAAVEEVGIVGPSERPGTVAVEIGRRLHDHPEESARRLSAKAVVEHIAAAAKQRHDDRAARHTATRHQQAPPEAGARNRRPLCESAIRRSTTHSHQRRRHRRSRPPARSPASMCAEETARISPGLAPSEIEQQTQSRRHRPDTS